MSRVDFYILPDDQLSSLQKYACKLAETYWQSGNRVLIQTDSEENSKTLNELLWNVREDSFIPHGIASLEPVDQQQPILISHQKVNDVNFQYVINLSSRPCDVPASNTPEKSESNTNDLKIDEILNQNEERKHSGRLNYKIYRDLGYTLEHHKLETVNG